MAIKHLQGKSSLPVIGKIRKGEMQGKRPVDLPYFKFVCADNAINDKVVAMFGDKPTEFTAFLFGNEPFTAWMQEWNTGSLLRRCDGEYVELELNGDKLSKPENKACLAPECKCKPNSILRLMIKKISPVSLFELTTNSINDITHIDSTINGIKEIAFSTGLPLDMFPIQFRKEKVNISVPLNGKRIRVDKYLVKMGIHPLFVEHIRKIAPTANNNHLLLPET